MVSKKPDSVVVTDPDILGCLSVFGGTRVPFQNLLNHLKEGGSIDDFLTGFPTVTRAQVVEALEYANESVRLRQAS